MSGRFRRTTVDARSDQQQPPQRTLDGQLARARGGSIIAIFAGAGYGKSALLDRLARSQQRGQLLLTVSANDGLPGRFLFRLIKALRPQIRADLAATLPVDIDPGDEVSLDRVINALRPVRLAWLLDNVHHLTGSGLETLTALLTADLPNATFYLAGRSVPAELPMSKLAIDGRVSWITAGDLDLGPKEFAAAMPAQRRLDWQRLYDQTGGWPAAVGALAKHPAGEPFIKVPELLRDYLDSEVLNELPPTATGLLMDAAITGITDVSQLDRIRGTEDSAAIHAHLKRAPVPLVDVEGDFLTIRPLLSEHLVARVRRQDPGRIGSLLLRLGESLTASGQFDEGFDQIRTRCDEATLVNFVYWQGVALTLRGHEDVAKRWLGTFSSESLHTYPCLVVLHTIICALDGEVEWLKPWLAMLHSFEREDAAPWGPGDPNVRYLLAELAGVEPIGAGAAAGLATDSPWGMVGRLLSVLKLLGQGKLAAAEAALVVLLPTTRGLPLFSGWAIAMAGFIYALTDRWAEGHQLIEEAVNESLSPALLNSRWSFFLDAVRAALTAHFGDRAGARLLVLKAERRLESVSGGPKVLRLAALAMMCQAVSGLDEPALLQRLQLKASQYAHESTFLSSLLGQPPGTSQAKPLLTDSQIRVLHYLSGPWTVPQIAIELGLSTATVRTHVRNIFQRLGANNRVDAVKQAQELGLL